MKSTAVGPADDSAGIRRNVDRRPSGTGRLPGGNIPWKKRENPWLFPSGCI